LHPLEHGEIDMVRASIREQQRLLKDPQQLVKPLQFLLASHVKHGSRLGNSLALRAALWVHQWLKRGMESDPCVPIDTTVFESNLDHGRKWSTFSYEDAQCEFPERLLTEWLVETIAAGGEASNHTEVLAIHRRSGRVTGVRVRESLTQAEGEIMSPWVINAAGPWVDLVLRSSNVVVERLVNGVRGTHLVLPTFLTAPKCAVQTREIDGNSLFVIPWNEQLLVGTTAVPDRGNPAFPEPSNIEVDQLMGRFTALFPDSGLTRADIRYVFSGIRPLPRSQGKEASIHRIKPVLHHHCEEGATGLISVIGVTLSTAMEAARKVVFKIGGATPEAQIALVAQASEEDELDTSLQQWAYMVAAKAGVSNAVAQIITEWYGREAMNVAQIASLDPRLRAPLCEHTLHLVAEAVHAFREEYASTLADILLRRVPVALGACWSAACSLGAANKIGMAIGWEQAEVHRQFEILEEERLKFLHPDFCSWQPAFAVRPREGGKAQAPREAEAKSVEPMPDQLPGREAA
jgi:glycerol-3-phosphate dehydrogenase